MKMKFFMLAAIIISSKLHAQTDSSKTLQTVVLTANKIEQKQNETGKVLTVISQQQLQKAGGKTIAELLNQEVGISIGGANNTLGANQTVFVRGASAANTLILLDGVPMYDASGISSEFDLNSFALDQIERIEILKGSQSTLYGSDAVAGVINIITKKSADKILKLHANLSAGSYNTYRGAVSVSGSNKTGFNYYLGYSKIYSDGFSSAYDSTGTGNFDKDGFKQDAINFNVGFNITKKLSARVYGKYNMNKSDIDVGAFLNDNDDRYETKNSNAGASLKYQLKNTSIHFNYNYNWYDRTYTNDSADKGNYTVYEKGRYNGNDHFAELYANVKFIKSLNLVAGVDYRTSATTQNYLSVSLFSPFPYESKPLDKDSIHTNQFATYASLLYNSFKGFTVGIGGRWNHHSVYGSNGTFSFNPSYQIKRIKIFANVSSGYRVPSLYQLYSEYGNTSLKPERSVSYDGGLQYNDKIFTARVVVFERDIKDVLAFYTDPATFISYYINEDKQKDYGVELEVSASIKKLSVSANYAYVDGKISTKDFTGKDTTLFNLYRRPKNTFNLNIGYSFLTAFVSAHLHTAAGSYEPKYGMPPVKLGNYYTLDMYGEYEFIKKIKLFADFRNITDQKYFDQEGFNTRRFNMNAGVILNL